MAEPLIELKDIYKIYHMGDEQVCANDGISLTITRGEFVAIVGKSGSGKSTLMNIIGALDVPTSGSYLLGGEDVGEMSDDQLADIRNRMIGFIFQQYNLLPKSESSGKCGAAASVRRRFRRRSGGSAQCVHWSGSDWQKNGRTCQTSYPADSSRVCPLRGRWREIRP